MSTQLISLLNPPTDFSVLSDDEFLDFAVRAMKTYRTLKGEGNPLADELDRYGKTVINAEYSRRLKVVLARVLGATEALNV